MILNAEMANKQMNCLIDLRDRSYLTDTARLLTKTILLKVITN